MGCSPTKDSSKSASASKDAAKNEAKAENEEDEEQKVPLEEGEQEQDKAESDIDKKSEQERKKSENESSNESKENSKDDLLTDIPALAEALNNKLEEQKEDGELASSAVARSPTDAERLADDKKGLISNIIDFDAEGSGDYLISRLDKSSFVYHTKAPDLVEGINSVVQKYQVVNEEDASTLDPRLLKVTKTAHNFHQRFHGAIVNHRWKLHDKGSTWDEYIMPLEQVISTKTVAKLPITPIEVPLTLTK